MRRKSVGGSSPDASLSPQKLLSGFIGRRFIGRFSGITEDSSVIGATLNVLLGGVEFFNASLFPSRISFSELRYVSSNAIIFGSTANNIGGSTYINVYRMQRTRRMTQRKKRYWLSFSVKRIGASGAELTMSWGSHVVDRYEGS